MIIQVSRDLRHQVQLQSLSQVLEHLMMSNMGVMFVPACVDNLVREKPLSGMFMGVHDGFHNAEGNVRSSVKAFPLSRLEAMPGVGSVHRNIYLSRVIKRDGVRT